MYVVAGFHKIVVSIAALRAAEYDPSQILTDSDTESEDGDSEMVNSVEISNSIWCLDLKTWQWTKLEPSGEAPLKCDKTAAWAFRDKARQSPHFIVSSRVLTFTCRSICLVGLVPRPGP